MNKFAFAIIGLSIACACETNGAQANPYASKVVVYPRVDATVSYAVDPAWPVRPVNLGWGQVCAVALDRQENIWIHTRTNQAVQVYAADGRFLKSWPAPGTNSIAHGLRIDPAGNVWLTDVGRHTVTKHAADDGRVLLTLGVVGEPGCDEKHFFKPTDIAFAPNGDIYVSDGYGNARIVHFDKDGKYLGAWGELGNKPGCFSIPHNVVCDSQGRIYVADRNNACIQVFDGRGRLLDVWRDLLVPWGLWITPQDEIWVCGSTPMVWTVDPKYPKAPLGCPPKDQVVMRFNTAGKLLQLWSFPKAADGEEKPGMLNWLHSIALDSQGNLYCTDIIGQRLQKFIRHAPAP